MNKNKEKIVFEHVDVNVFVFLYEVAIGSAGGAGRIKFSTVVRKVLRKVVANYSIRRRVFEKTCSNRSVV